MNYNNSKMQAVFVNTEDKPLNILRQGVFKYSASWDKPYKLSVFELCEVVYPHPDAPDHAIVSLYRWLPVDVEPGTEQLIKLTVDAMNGLKKITKLPE